MESKYGETTVDSSQQSKAGTLTPTTPDTETSQQIPREHTQGSTLKAKPSTSQKMGEPEIQTVLPANAEDETGKMKEPTRKRPGQDEKVASSKPGEEQKKAREEQVREASKELMFLLRKIETYFSKQAMSHDLESVSFSLRHLFNRVDFLYRQALPDLNGYATQAKEEHASEVQEAHRRQQIWLQLQSINRTLDRMAPLCHLLSDGVECLLDTLDNEEIWLHEMEVDDTLHLEQIKLSTSGPRPEKKSRERHKGAETEHWERAVATLMDRLLNWQEQHHKLGSFQQMLTQSRSIGPDLSELDAAFAILLDCAGAIFGDILPNFRLIKADEKEEISALLFDLMQQSDQMLVQFEVTLEPMNRLIRHFAVNNDSV